MNELAARAVKVLAALVALTTVVVAIVWVGLTAIRPPEPALRTDLGPSPKLWTPTPSAPGTSSAETTDATMALEASDTASADATDSAADIASDTVVAALPLPGDPFVQAPYWPMTPGTPPFAPGPVSVLPTSPGFPGPVAVVPFPPLTGGEPPAAASPPPAPEPPPAPAPQPGNGRGRGHAYGLFR